MRKENRRIQLTGGSTYIISLPKKWVIDNNLKKGDVVSLIYDKNKIIISCSPEKLVKKEIEYRVDDKIEPIDVVRQVISFYLAGYEVIKIIFSRSSEIMRATLKKMIRKKMVGFEVTDEGSNYMEIRSLLRHGEISISFAINRLLKLTEIILRDTLNALYKFDKTSAENIIAQDDDIDRLYLFITRNLRYKVSHAIEEEEPIEPYEYIIYSMLIKAVERICDHAVRISHIIKEMKTMPPQDIYNAIIIFMEHVVFLYTKSYKAFVKRDVREAQNVINTVKNLATVESDLVKKIERSKLSLHQAILMRIVLESIRRIGEYTSDIGEMTIDVATTPPEYTE